MKSIWYFVGIYFLLHIIIIPFTPSFYICFSQYYTPLCNGVILWSSTPERLKFVPPTENTTMLEVPKISMDLDRKYNGLLSSTWKRRGNSYEFTLPFCSAVVHCSVAALILRCNLHCETLRKWPLSLCSYQEVFGGNSPGFSIYPPSLGFQGRLLSSSFFSTLNATFKITR